MNNDTTVAGDIPPTMEPSSKSADEMDVDKEVSLERKDEQQSVSSIVQKPRASSLPVKYPDFTVGYVYSSEMMSHFSPQGHPEQPQRIQRIWLVLKLGELIEKMKWLPIREVRKDEVLLVHSEDHWNKVLALQCEFVYELYIGTLCHSDIRYHRTTASRH